MYWDYAKSVGLCTTLSICLLYAGQSSAAIGANVWLSAWSNDAMEHSRQNNTSVRLGVYAALGLLQGDHMGALTPSSPLPTPQATKSYPCLRTSISPPGHPLSHSSLLSRFPPLG